MSTNLQDLLQGFDEVVQAQITAIQAKSNTVVDFTQGSILLAIINSNAGLSVMLQSLITYLYAYARASTCVSNDPNVINPDLDTWMFQFKFFRLPATFATTTVDFSRLNNTQQAVIPLNTIVTTTIGNIQFQVIKDTSNPNWNSSLNGYVMAINGDLTISVPVQAVKAGTSGNVLADQINLIVSAIPFVNSVNNPSDVTNAVNIESDADFLARFQLYINNLAKATPGAIDAAIEAVQDGILYNVLNWTGIDQSGNPIPNLPGIFSVIIDDGTGDPPDSLVTSVYNAIAVTRALGIIWGVYKTTPVSVSISANLLLDPTYDADALVAAVTQAISTYINNLDVGESLFYSKLPNVIYIVSQGILNVENLQINGATADVIPTSVQSIKAGTITLTTSNPS